MGTDGDLLDDGHIDKTLEDFLAKAKSKKLPFNEKKKTTIKRPLEKDGAEKKSKKFRNGSLGETKNGDGNAISKHKQFNSLNGKKSFGENKGASNKEGGSSTTKPNWAELKKESKEKRKERRQKKCTAYDKTVEAKKLWEKLRQEKGDHTATTSELYNLLKTDFAKVIFTHEMSRVVQWLLHLGSEKMRSSIIEELQPVLKKMIESKYASKCVKKMLKYGNKKSKEIVVESFMGNIVKLTRHVLSAPIVEFAYNNGATKAQKNLMHQELYSDWFKTSSKDSAVNCLADSFKLMPDMKNVQLECVKKNLSKMIAKNTNQSGLFYFVLNDFLQHCSKEDKVEMLAHLHTDLGELVDTMAAAEVGMQCVIQATTKEKKTIMKSLKGHIVTMCKARFNHRIILALIDSIDDTVAFGKILLPEIVASVNDLAAHQFGRKVIAYLVVYRDVNFFGTKELELEKLKAFLVDSTGKKPTEIRQQEIRKIISVPFLEAIAANPLIWFADSKICLVALAILTTGSGEPLKKALTAVAKIVCDPGIKINEVQADKKTNKLVPLVEQNGISWVLKKLIQNDFGQDGKLFASVLAENLTDETIKFWLTFNRGSFDLVMLLETGNNKITSLVATKLQPFIAEMKTMNSKAVGIILRKLSQKYVL